MSPPAYYILAVLTPLSRSHRLLLLQHLLPLLLKTIFERSVFSLMHDGTHVVLFSPEQFLSKLATEFEDFLILLIKLVSDEVEVAETRPGWMRVLAMKIIRLHPPVIIKLLLIIWRLSTHVTRIQTLRGRRTMRSTWQRYDTLATNGDSDAGSTSGARVLTLFASTLQPLVTSCSLLLGVSSQMWPWVHLWATRCHIRIVIVVCTALRRW